MLDRLDRALNLVAIECLAKYNLKWPRVRPISDPDDTELDTRYGNIDVEIAKRYGYSTPPGHGGGTDDEPAEEEPWDPDADAVMIGRVSEYKGVAVPKGGCAGEATRVVSGVEPGPPPPVPLARRRANEAHKYAEWDGRVKKAVTRWSLCMREAGFDYDSPKDASGDPRWGKSERPARLEIDTATADVQCKIKTNLAGIWFAVESAYQQRALDDNRAELEKVRKRIAAEDRRAREILGE